MLATEWYLTRAPPSGSGGDALPIDVKHPERWYIPGGSTLFSDGTTPVADESWDSDRDFKPWMTEQVAETLPRPPEPIETRCDGSGPNVKADEQLLRIILPKSSDGARISPCLGDGGRGSKSGRTPELY